MNRTGTADLPLHGGRVPQWLYTRMAAIGREIIQAVALEYGTSGVLSRLADPFWFQALGCVMGMDWHSSGITASVLGALKTSVNPLFNELGIYLCGGKGAYSRGTPQELIAFAERTGNDGAGLVQASRLSAKVDNTCINDGFSLYLHNFIVSRSGEWVVVQQGMNATTAYARRYHWHSAKVSSFVDDPHTAVVGSNLGTIMNLSDRRAAGNRQGILSFLAQHPDRQMREMRHLELGRSHGITPAMADGKRLGAVFALAYEQQYQKFTDALLLPGVGPRTLQALALVSEVIYGSPHRFSDPARFAFAHGGKDGHPFPVPLKIYDESIGSLRSAVERAKLGHSDKLHGLKVLNRMADYIERNQDPFADVGKVIDHERKRSHQHGGMTVFGPARKKDHSLGSGVQQMSLFGDDK